MLDQPATLAAPSHNKRIKRWKHDLKIQLIETANPNWRDLIHDLI